jgi:hypothetical protein
MFRPTLLRPDRLRNLEPPFGWAPCRLLTTGLLARLSLPAKALYLALCLAADRQGLSYWSQERLCQQIGLEEVELGHARQELQQRDLLAFDGRVYQILSLPKRRSKPSVDKPRRRKVELRLGSPTLLPTSSSPESLAEIIRRLEARYGFKNEANDGSE